MTREKAIVLIECSANELRETLKETTMPSSASEQLQMYIDAYEMAISALRQQEHFRDLTKKVEPLTLDELRKMPIGDWVWIDVLHSKEAVSSYYRKYDGYKKDEIFWCGYPGLGFRFFYEDYGKAWLAYRQKPEEV